MWFVCYRKQLRDIMVWRAVVFVCTFTTCRHTTIFMCTLHTWITILQALQWEKLTWSTMLLTISDWWATSINAKRSLAYCEKMMNSVTFIASRDNCCSSRLYCTLLQLLKIDQMLTVSANTIVCQCVLYGTKCTFPREHCKVVLMDERKWV